MSEQDGWNDIEVPEDDKKLNLKLKKKKKRLKLHKKKKKNLFSQKF